MSAASQSLGKVIGQLRREQGLSQEAFAERAGLHRTYVSQLERGLKSPTIDVLTKLADALEMKPSDILIYQEEALNELQD